jgi:hypothetical protein
LHILLVAEVPIKVLKSILKKILGHQRYEKLIDMLLKGT